MHFSHLLLGLVASASAIDVYFHESNDCSGAATICTGLSPNLCCTGNSPTVAYRGVPTNWQLNAQGMSGGGCRTPKWLAEFRGQSWVCMAISSRENYTGSYYWFVSRRRAEETSCTESVKPDTLVLADGVTKYDIVGLDDGKVEELVSPPFVDQSHLGLSKSWANWPPPSSLRLLVPELVPKGCRRTSRCGASKTEARDLLDAEVEFIA